MDIWEDLGRPFAFSFDSEWVHTQAVGAAALGRPLIPRGWSLRDPRLAVHLWGLTFDNPVGLAAGFDKDGRFARVAVALGFGLHTLGTATPLAQAGNDKPRMFRIVQQRGLVNRMGFNNPGIDAVVGRLAEARAALPDYPFGLSIGKNKATPQQDARTDYRLAYERGRTLARYVEVNVSSPNTAGLRDLQTGGFLRDLLSTLRDVDEGADDGVRPPILLKVAPDLDEGGLAAVAELARDGLAQGIVATNTLPHDGPVDGHERAQGGLSGAPIATRSLEQLRALRRLTGPDVVLVAAGGIETGEQAWQRIRAGASLVQIYTSFVYRGPLAARRINEELLGAMDRDGVASVSDGVGLDA